MKTSERGQSRVTLEFFGLSNSEARTAIYQDGKDDKKGICGGERSVLKGLFGKDQSINSCI